MTPLQQGWIQPPSWKGDYSDAVPREQQCTPARLGQSGIQTFPQNLSFYIVRGAYVLESTEDKGTGDTNGHTKGFSPYYSIYRLGQYSKQSLLVCRIPLTLTQKTAL